jgi:hypothetical protein
VAAFGIDRGLLLEDRGVWLPWGSTPDELRRAELPALETPHELHGFRMYWRGGRCLGGLAAACVSTKFGAPDWPQEKLRGIRVVLLPQEPGEMGRAFDRGQPEFVRRFGPPEFVRVGQCEGVAEWRFGDVVLRHEFWDDWVSERCAYLFLAEDRPAEPSVAPRPAAAD